MVGYVTSVRTFGRDVVLYLLAWGGVSFGYGGVQAVLLNLYLLRLGYGPEFIGLLIGSGQLVWALLALPAGALGARLGLRRAMQGGVVLIAVANVLLLSAEALPAAWRSAWLVGSWMLEWVGAALWVVNGVPYLMAATTDAGRGHAFAVQQAIIAVAAFAGSVVAGWLPGVIAAQMGATDAAAAPYRYALWAAPAAFVVAGLLLGGMRRVEPVTVAAPGPSTSRAPLALLGSVGLLVFLQTLGDGAGRSFFNIYLDDGLGVGTALIGALAGIAQLLPVAAALAAPLLFRRAGVPGTFRLSLLVLICSLVVLGLVPNRWAASAALMGVMASAAVSGPARAILSQAAVAPSERGAMSAMVTMGTGLGWAATASAGGLIIARAGYSSLFVLGALCVVAALGLFLAFCRLGRALRGGGSLCDLYLGRERAP
ncbi:MAG: MFS transporter [Chloroflexi bacterium]|nr:MFS transporter [Chloroflexota bacterium]